jgi:ectoine hydroxylase-related dioxygenase (phytanoyl-CoA dioxygenase family)
VPEVAVAARKIRAELTRQGVLAGSAVAVQAIAFDKTPEANWKVTWHQDVMFPFASAVRAPGYDLATKKDGGDYARPPRAVLEGMLAVRVHLDDCDATNGPLRVAPGSNACGILRSSEIDAAVQRHGETQCLARAGDALLMRPLLLHASSPATAPKHRRVLHLVYYSGDPIAEQWYRTV